MVMSWVDIVSEVGMNLLGGIISLEIPDIPHW